MLQHANGVLARIYCRHWIGPRKCVCLSITLSINADKLLEKGPIFCANVKQNNWEVSANIRWQGRCLLVPVYSLLFTNPLRYLAVLLKKALGLNEGTWKKLSSVERGCCVIAHWKIRKVFRSFQGRLQKEGRGSHEWIVSSPAKPTWRKQKKKQLAFYESLFLKLNRRLWKTKKRICVQTSYW